MRKLISKSKYIEFDFNKKEDISSVVKKSIAAINVPDIDVDLSTMNILDAAKVMVLTSVYHSGKFPEGKIRCHLSESQKCNFINPFITKNLELV